MTEIQVFRLTPQVGRFYYTTTYTRKMGKWPNETYYSTKALRYVGQFVKHHQLGAGEGAIHYDIFKDGDNVKKVDYTYEGTTCFVETNPPSSSSETYGIASSAANIASYKNKKQQSDLLDESDITFGIDPLPPVEVPDEAPKTAIKTSAPIPQAKKAAATLAKTTSSSNKVEYSKDVYMPKPPPESPPDPEKKRWVCCCIQ